MQTFSTVAGTHHTVGPEHALHNVACFSHPHADDEFVHEQNFCSCTLLLVLTARRQCPWAVSELACHIDMLLVATLVVLVVTMQRFRVLLWRPWAYICMWSVGLLHWNGEASLLERCQQLTRGGHLCPPFVFACDVNWLNWIFFFFLI